MSSAGTSSSLEAPKKVKIIASQIDMLIKGSGIAIDESSTGGSFSS